MPEIKNNFLQSKMNKDLDARLIPNGQYRSAQNININKSEGPDVGAIENVLGNFKLTDFGLGASKAEVIGSYFDDINERIYVFITNYTDASLNRLSNNCAGYPTFSQSTNQGVCCALVYFDFPTGSTATLLFGPWLNFSLTHPILGVTLIENQLFFTDARNQPRKINVDNAISAPYDLSSQNYNNPFYINEDQISVAKYYPYKPIQVADNGALNSATNQAAGSFVVGTIYDITSGGGSGGKIQITTTTGGAIVIAGGEGYSTSFTQLINGVTYNLTAGATGLMKDVVSEDLPLPSEIDISTAGSYNVAAPIAYTGGPITQSIGSTVRVVDAPGTASIVPEGTQLLAKSGSDIKLSKAVTFAVGAKLVIGANPDYDPNYQGDEQVLRDDFVKFAYRLKFIDNEYSLISPFTQACFIPKQWGYYLKSDFIDTYQSTITTIMENLVNQIDFKIPAPDKIDQTQMTWVEAIDLLHLQSIDIIWNSATDPNFKVLDTIDLDTITQKGVSNVYTYKYVSRKPIRTLPETDITRVSDKVPVRAKAQESVGNRIVYANYVQNLGRPKSLPYNVSIDEKFKDAQSSNLNIATDPILRVEYPNHSVKQNRTYQVGIVLVDRYGRQSDVILSSNDDFQGAVDFQGSTIFHQYRTSGQPLRTNANYQTDIWPGDSIKCLFTNVIPKTFNVRGYAGLWEDDQSNATGWYSYKVVVKQQEQEYYNAYVPGILNNYAQEDVGSAVTSNSIANIVLIGDNINKIPRELQDVGPEQRQFAAEVDLWCRLDSGNYGSSIQYYPNRDSDTVRLIGTFTDLHYNRTNPGVDGGENAGVEWVPTSTPTQSTDPYVVSPFYNVPGNNFEVNSEMKVPFETAGNDTLIARISTEKAMGRIGGAGITGGSNGNPWLGVPENILWYQKPPLGIFEVRPVSSNLDIYWETSTSGKISSLNTSILTGDTTTPIGLQAFNFSFNEGMPPLTFVSSSFYPLGNGNIILNNPNTTVTVTSVLNGISAPIDIFDVVRDNGNNSFRLRIKANKYSVYLQTSPTVDNYTITFSVTNVDGQGNTITSQITVNPPNLLGNINPGWIDNGGSLGPAPSTGNNIYGGGREAEWPFGAFNADQLTNPVFVNDPSDPSVLPPFNLPSPPADNTFDVVNSRAAKSGAYLGVFKSTDTFDWSILASGWNGLVSLNGFNGSYASGVSGIPFLIKTQLVWKPLNVDFWWSGRINANNESEPAWRSMFEKNAVGETVITSSAIFQDYWLDSAQRSDPNGTYSGNNGVYSGGQLFSGEMKSKLTQTGNQEVSAYAATKYAGQPSPPPDLPGTGGFLQSYGGGLNPAAVEDFIAVSNEFNVSAPTQAYNNVPETVFHKLRGLAHWYSDLRNVYAAYPGSSFVQGANTPLYCMHSKQPGTNDYYMPQYEVTAIGNYNYQSQITSGTQLPAIQPNTTVFTNQFGTLNRPYLGNVAPANLPFTPPSGGANDTLYRVTMRVYDAADTSVSSFNDIYLYFFVSNEFAENQGLTVNNQFGGGGSGEDENDEEG